VLSSSTCFLYLRAAYCSLFTLSCILFLADKESHSSGMIHWVLPLTGPFTDDQHCAATDRMTTVPAPDGSAWMHQSRYHCSRLFYSPSAAVAYSVIVVVVAAQHSGGRNDRTSAERPPPPPCGRPCGTEEGRASRPPSHYPPDRPLCDAAAPAEAK
jgi:hypothetical protein